jgi:hypothetical protein
MNIGFSDVNLEVTTGGAMRGSEFQPGKKGA